MELTIDDILAEAEKYGLEIEVVSTAESFKSEGFEAVTAYIMAGEEWDLL
jgi:hypothetical protein